MSKLAWSYAVVFSGSILPHANSTSFYNMLSGRLPYVDIYVDRFDKKMRGSNLMYSVHPNIPGRNTAQSRKRSRSIALIAVLCLFLLGTGITISYSLLQRPAGAQADTLATLPGHVPALIKKSQLLGPTDPTTSITLIIGLRPRNQAGLKAYVDSISRRTSVTGRHYLTPAQVIAAFSPLPASQDAVISYMQQMGLKETVTFKHHLLIGFQGTIGQAEQAFHIQINNYRSPAGSEFYAPSSEPSVPSSLGSIIQSISGLDTVSHFTHPPIRSSKQITTSASAPQATTCIQQTSSSPWKTPRQITGAYNITGLYNSGFRGEGQRVGLFELDDYSAGDIQAYTSCYGGASVPISRILVSGGTGHGPGSGAIEVELDMELVLSTAPRLASLRVYEAPNSASGVLAEWGQIVSDGVPVVSTSWGICEAHINQSFAQQENTLLLVAAAQGQSVFAASGDTGSDGCNNGNLGVDDPAAQPLITGVGGTSLSLSTDSQGNGIYNSETVWNNGTIQNSPRASGGGISMYWTIPSWQHAIGVPSADSSATPCAANTGNTGQNCREVPDVALDADPNTGYIAYCSAGSTCQGLTWISIGGTSAAAPMWAAMIALANEKSLHDGNFNLGYINPLLYQLAQTGGSNSSYSLDFHDITVGNNATSTTSLYPSTTGYDMATGLGSSNALPLATDLEKLAQGVTNTRAAPANTTWYFAEGSVGNSFQEYITLLNPSATQTATVNLTYLFQNKPAVTVQHSVNPGTRSTVSANADLHVASTAPQQAISFIVQSNVPIVAERPMYFNFHGIKSGTDVVGATHATNTSFYFAEADTRLSSKTYYTYVTMLNPSQASTAHVVITYYSNGAAVGTENVNVGPLQRGTGSPSYLNIHQQVAIKVTSDIGIVVERPMYFSDTITTAGGLTTGAASAVAATTLGSNAGSDWLFAEGYTGTNFQEYLVLANFTATNATTTVKLEYTNGTVQSVPITVNALSQYYFDVNNASAHPVANCGCSPTGSVSAEVTSPTASIVAERLMYFHYGSARISGGTDAVGEAGPSSHAVYAFAEGYTNTNFNEYLTLQNPNGATETVAITLFADMTIIQEMLQLQPHSRTTVGINGLVVPMATAFPTNPSYVGFEVSMDIQVVNAGGGSGTIVAERPLYFNYFGDPGGTDVIGYTGN
jgi:subtilase family serine protease